MPPFVGVLARPEFGTMPAGLTLGQHATYHANVTLDFNFGVAGSGLPCPSSSGGTPFARFELGIVLHDEERDRNWWISWSLFRQAWPEFFCGIDDCFIFVNAAASTPAQAGGPPGLPSVEAGGSAGATFDLAQAVTATLEVARQHSCPLPPLDQNAAVIGLWAGAEAHGEAVASFEIADLLLDPPP